MRKGKLPNGTPRSGLAAHFERNAPHHRQGPVSGSTLILESGQRLAAILSSLLRPLFLLFTWDIAGRNQGFLTIAYCNYTTPRKETSGANY
jgi:hypothetical protein